MPPAAWEATYLIALRKTGGLLNRFESRENTDLPHDFRGFFRTGVSMGAHAAAKFPYRYFQL
jgi:hypothetical protein